MNAYSITAPEEIAKKYGGNKKKIQQAATQGLINPTEAVMAGMFIDRMRNAAAQEQAQQPTVAEQVMNPQPQMPPQGMAATPQAQQMAQRPPQMSMPQQMPRMAMGGGVNSIDYVEGNYAPGGIVSFSKGAVLSKEQLLAQLGQAYMAAGSAQERADINAQIENIKKMGTVTSPGGQAITDSRLNQDASFTGAAPLTETNLFDQLKNAEPAAVPGEAARQARIAAANPVDTAPVEESSGFTLPGFDAYLNNMRADTQDAKRLQRQVSSTDDAGLAAIPVNIPAMSDIDMSGRDKALAGQNVTPDAFTGATVAADPLLDAVEKGKQVAGRSSTAGVFSRADTSQFDDPLVLSETVSEANQPISEGLKSLGRNIATPFAALYDTAVGLPAAVLQNTYEFGKSKVTGETPQYVTSAPAQTALFDKEPSINIPFYEGPQMGPQSVEAEAKAKKVAAAQEQMKEDAAQADANLYSSAMSGPSTKSTADANLYSSAMSDTAAPVTLADQVKQANDTAEVLKPKTVEKDDSDAAETALKAANDQADAMTKAAKTTASDDFQKQIEDLMKPAEKGEFRKEMEALVKDRGARLKSAKKEAFSMALLQAGLGMLGQGGGQTALQALGKAALPATKDYAAAVKDAKKEDRDLLQLGLSMEQMDAKELAATKRAVAQLYGKRSAAMLQAATSQANNMRTTAASKYGADVRKEVGLAQAAAQKATADQTGALRKQLSNVETLRMERSELNDLVDKQAKALQEDPTYSMAKMLEQAAYAKLAKDPQNEALRAEYILAQNEAQKAQAAFMSNSPYAKLIQEQRGVVQSLGTSAVDFSSLNP